MTDDELNDWGIEFLNQVERDLNQPGKEDAKLAWESGEVNDCIRMVRDDYPDLDDEQVDWVYEFLTEL